MITRVEEGEAVVQGDEVVRALLTAMATLEDLVEVGHDSQSALSTLEDIAYELGRMDSSKRQQFIEVLERVAAEEPGRAVWIRGIPDALGLDR
ncbi:hypothetical protein OG417_34295 [Actinoallomurus sp. NBC_01490]|uniref:hypothetical protein n=1 Tax=Actinoallomurus sp. NBC_01490 TaxID=2903557 RepID=UPI002E3577D7|nr:hypothetical protein [Actinoallomurus sp. NBC_01490]